MAANYPSTKRENPHQFPFLSGLLLTLIGIILSTLLASCTSEKPRDPISIVQTAYDRINNGDVEGFMELFSDDAVLIDRNGRYVGSQAIREYMQRTFVPEQVRIELSDLSADGNVVTYISKVYHGDQLLATHNDGLDVIADDRIVFDGTKEYLLEECQREPSQAFCPGN